MLHLQEIRFNFTTALLATIIQEPNWSQVWGLPVLINYIC